MKLIRTLKNLAHFLNASLAVLYYGSPATKLKVIGVTGTDGKTTTSTMIYHILNQAKYKVALISTVAAYIGDEQIDTGFHVTTPSPWQLQKLLKRIAEKGFEYVVLEATSHGFDQHRVLGTNIKTAVITNVTHEHLDYHKTFDNYLSAKAKVMAYATTAFLNGDDKSFTQLKKLAPATCTVIPYSIFEPTSLKPTIMKKFSESYNYSNAWVASLVSLHHQVPEEVIRKAIETFPGVPGRMQQIPNQKGITAIVDFAHTPNALKEALSAARQTTRGKLIVVFGAAGKRDISKRPLMGKYASELANEVVLTAEDPRGEDIRINIGQIKSGATKNRGHLHGVPDRRDAIRFALKLAQKGDTVIVCGKGHEQSMNIDGKHEIPWSDATVLAEELLQ